MLLIIVIAGESTTGTWRYLCCFCICWQLSVAYSNWLSFHTRWVKSIPAPYFVVQPENLLLDASGNLKVSDFGLSALSQQVRVMFEILNSFSFEIFLFISSSINCILNSKLVAYLHVPVFQSLTLYACSIHKTTSNPCHYAPMVDMANYS